MDAWSLYVLSFYFMTTTMTTVGYGDHSANNHPERIFLIVAQLVGVIVFAFISGSLTSIL
jgi:hypothetical protein